MTLPLMVRLTPVLILAIAAMFYAASVEQENDYLWRNLLPMHAVVLIAVVTLVRGRGYWTGDGWRMPLATVGFALPTLGLSMYLHYGYSIDLNGMVSESVYPNELFRYLPIYTSVAGIIGFAIGWIVGRNV
jgi:hypothetical protein